MIEQPRAEDLGPSAVPAEGEATRAGWIGTPGIEKQSLRTLRRPVA